MVCVGVRVGIDVIYCQKVEVMGIGDVVYWLGYVLEVQLCVFYCGVGFFVYFIFYEGFGLLVIEVMVFGMFVIILNNLVLCEIVEGYVYFVSLLEVDEIEVVIVYCFNDWEYVQSLVMFGR